MSFGDLKSHLFAILFVLFVSGPVAFVYFSVFDLSLPPVTNWRNDLISPREVKPGGTVTIYRSFTATREAPIYVTRTMVRGDCKKQCDFRDLTSSILYVEPGEYVNAKRVHTIPAGTEEGVWKLRFYAHWENRLGNTRTIALPELEIEVVR